jgi:hypothetical protein
MPAARPAIESAGNSSLGERPQFEEREAVEVLQRKQAARSGEPNGATDESDRDHRENCREGNAVINDDGTLGCEGPQIAKHRDIGHHMRDDKSSEEKPMHDDECCKPWFELRAAIGMANHRL